MLMFVDELKVAGEIFGTFGWCCVRVVAGGDGEKAESVSFVADAFNERTLLKVVSSQQKSIH